MHNTFSQLNTSFTVPFKSAAAALLFGAILGPVGLLYSSLVGGVVMIVLSVYAVRIKLYAVLILFWLVSCVWSVAAANRFNRNLLRMLIQK